MQKNLRWKLLVIAVVTGLSIWSFTPPSQKIALGLDLKGGAHFVLEVKTDDALRLETETSSEQLRVAAKDAGIAITTRVTALDTVRWSKGFRPECDQQFRTLADQQTSLAFTREATGGGTHTFQHAAEHRRAAARRGRDAGDPDDRAPGQRARRLRADRRAVRLDGQPDPRPASGLSDIDRAKNIIGQTAVLELTLVEAGPAADQATLLQAVNGQVPPDLEIVGGAAPGMGGGVLPGSEGAGGHRPRPSQRASDARRVQHAGRQLLAEQRGRREVRPRRRRTTSAGSLAIVLDNQVMSAPRIDGPIEREGRITGTFTPQEASDLALVLRSGALPASLTYLEQREVGPSLGADSIRAGVTASLVGPRCSSRLFMLTYYKLAGINAFVSIALNLVILLGFMAYLGAVMTLPGIAGFILTIGMGVDSNVLIFERIREELGDRRRARARRSPPASTASSSPSSTRTSRRSSRPRSCSSSAPDRFAVSRRRSSLA